MYQYLNAFTNRSGDALPGYFARLFDAGGNVVDLFSDNNGTPIATVSGVANAALSDSNGMFRWFVANGTYDMRFYDPNEVFVSVELSVPMIDASGVYLDLSADDGATLVGTPTGTVQTDLNARPTSATLAGAGGAATIGAAEGGTAQGSLDGKALASALGVTGSAVNMGTFTGATIPDNQTAKQAIQALETAGEATAATVSGSTALATATERSTAVLARSYLPFAAVGAIPVGDLIPTSTNPVAALRLHQDWILVRVRAASLAGSTPSSVYYDEYIFKDPRNYSGVDGGWQLVAHRAFVADKYVSWIIAPDADGGIPNSDFAIRLGKFDAANTNPSYHSGGEGPAYYYAGFGHGRMYNLRSGNQIILNGGGANLQDTANWPVGTRIYGTTLSIGCQFKLRAKHWRTGGTDGALASNPFATSNGSGVVTVTHVAHGYSNGQIVHYEGAAAVGGVTAAQLNTRLTVTVVNADSYTVATAGTASSSTSGGGAVVMAYPEIVSLQYDGTFGASGGLTRKGTMTTTLAGFGWQDSYGYMDPINAITATRIKPNGESAVSILRDSIQKMTSTTGTASQFQAYNDAQTGIFQQFNLSYAQPVRRQGGGGPAAWGLNKAARYFMADNPDFAKVYCLLCSSEEALPRTAWELSTGDVWEWQSTLKTTFGTLL